MSEQHKRFLAENPGKVEEYALRQRERGLGAGEEVTAELIQFVYKFQNKTCAICGSKQKLHLDHWLPFSKGHAFSITNAVVLCCSCNVRKKARYPTEIYDSRITERIGRMLYDQRKAWETRL